MPLALLKHVREQQSPDSPRKSKSCLTVDDLLVLQRAGRACCELCGIIGLGRHVRLLAWEQGSRPTEACKDPSTVSACCSGFPWQCCVKHLSLTRLQGGAADLVKLAMINLQRVLDHKSQYELPLPMNGPPPCRLVLQVNNCFPASAMHIWLACLCPSGMLHLSSTGL